MTNPTLEQLIRPWLIQIESIDLKIQDGDSRIELVNIRNFCIKEINTLLK